MVRVDWCEEYNAQDFDTGAWSSLPRVWLSLGNRSTVRESVEGKHTQSRG